MAERRRAEKAELAALKSHARASAHHATRFVDGESPTPRPHHAARAVDGPQTNTMTDAKMLQLVSMLEKICNLRDRSLGTPVAARNVHSIDETISAITEYACARVLVECEQEAGVAIVHGSTSESYTSSDGPRRHGGQTHTRPTALARRVVAGRAAAVAEDWVAEDRLATMAAMADEAWQGPPEIPTARPTDPSAVRAMRAGDDPAINDAETWRPVTRLSGVDGRALAHDPD